jgi:hypothetical protein
MGFYVSVDTRSLPKQEGVTGLSADDAQSRNFAPTSVDYLGERVSFSRHPKKSAHARRAEKAAQDKGTVLRREVRP